MTSPTLPQSWTTSRIHSPKYPGPSSSPPWGVLCHQVQPEHDPGKRPSEAAVTSTTTAIASTGHCWRLNLLHNKCHSAHFNIQQRPDLPADSILNPVRHIRDINAPCETHVDVQIDGTGFLVPDNNPLAARKTRTGMHLLCKLLPGRPVHLDYPGDCLQGICHIHSHYLFSDQGPFLARKAGRLNRHVPR